MNSRQRILPATHHQPVDRFPTDIWASPEVWEKLYDHFAISGRSPADPLALYEQIGIDAIIGIAPPYIEPTLPVKDGNRYDEWGMGYRLYILSVEPFPTIFQIITKARNLSQKKHTEQMP